MIVATNGCFDCFHAGHYSLLDECNMLAWSDLKSLDINKVVAGEDSVEIDTMTISDEGIAAENLLVTKEGLTGGGVVITDEGAIATSFEGTFEEDDGSIEEEGENNA